MIISRNTSSTDLQKLHRVLLLHETFVRKTAYINAYAVEAYLVVLFFPSFSHKKFLPTTKNNKYPSIFLGYQYMGIEL